MHPKNFIRFNIQNVKGTRKPPLYLQDLNKLSRSLSRSKSPYNSVNKQIQSRYHRPHISDRIENIQKSVQQIQRNRSQSYIINQISQIKDDLKMIKSHLFEVKKSNIKGDRRNTYESQDDNNGMINLNSNVNVMMSNNINNNHNNNNNNDKYNKRLKSQMSEVSFKQSKFGRSQQQYNQYNNNNHKVSVQYILSQKNHSLNTKSKGILLKSISPILKQYKLQSPQFGHIFSGYIKRTSQSIIIKYNPSTTQLNHIIQIYQKLWKNITRAPWVCINRIYDYKIDDNNFLILQKNMKTIINLPWKSVIIDVFRILEFIHQCGYLYRNVEVEHFMLNQDGRMVVVDFKRMKRYVDVKGHQLEVIEGNNIINNNNNNNNNNNINNINNNNNTNNNNNIIINNNNNTTISMFASNNQLRGYHQGRKDDLQSLGYLALVLMQYDIPWYGLSKQQIIKIRSTLTLQQLFKGNQQWIQYMATVMRSNKNDRPDYRKLQEILEKL